MAKHDKLSDSSSIVIVDDGVDIQPDMSDNKLITAVSRVKLVLTIPAHTKRIGPVTGEPYEWKYAGDVVEVSEEDVEPLLLLRLGESICCGGSSDSNYIFKRF